MFLHWELAPHPHCWYVWEKYMHACVWTHTLFSLQKKKMCQISGKHAKEFFILFFSFPGFWFVFGDFSPYHQECSLNTKPLEDLM